VKNSDSNIHRIERRLNEYKPFIRAGFEYREAKNYFRFNTEVKAMDVNDIFVDVSVTSATIISTLITLKS